MPETKAKHSNYQRIVSLFAVSLLSFAGLELLVYINHVYVENNILYNKLAGIIYLLLFLWLNFIFDLHFREDHLTADSLWHAIKLRFKHFVSWEKFRHFQNYLILPSIIYWGSVLLIGINLDHAVLQQFIAIVSGLSLVIVYTLFKEVFHNKITPIKESHFLTLSYIKLYACWLAYASLLGIIWYYCFPPHVFYFTVALVTLMLLYQALFQFANVNLSHILLIVIITIAMGFVSFFVFNLWNVNYFTAGVFMVAVYNLFWNFLFNGINKKISKGLIFEQLAIFILVVVMLFGSTNFRAKIDRCTNNLLMPPGYEQQSTY